MFISIFSSVRFYYFSVFMSRAHSPTFPSLHLRHNSFYNPSLALPTSQLILEHFRCFTYITAHSPTLFSLLLHHRLFTYVTWGAAHDWSLHCVFMCVCVCILGRQENVCVKLHECDWIFLQYFPITIFIKILQFSLNIAYNTINKKNWEP